VAHDLAEALVSLGHEVTVFAPAGSTTSARLVETVAGPLDSTGADPRLAEEMHLAIAIEAARDLRFDVIHSHLHVHALVYSRLLPVPLLTTLHGAAWDGANHPLLLRYAEMPFVSISDSERNFLPQLNYIATIPNGIRTGEIPVGPGRGGYLVFAGRMAPEKGPDLAIEVALAADLPLRLAGFVEDRHREFFEDTMARSRSKSVEYLGVLDREDLWRLLGDAKALVMPLRWDEPFGLVVVESLATGTPVVAWRMGAMPEIIEPDVTGFLVDDVAEAVDAIGTLGDISREDCRTAAETRFADRVMASAYSELYSALARPSGPGPGRPGPSQL
jgi:glycosyltransferase involved in cell wall biosynthesis